MIYDFITQPDRRDTGSLKWERFGVNYLQQMTSSLSGGDGSLSSRVRHVLPMWVADMDFLSPPEVLEALRQRVDHGVFGYTIPPESTVTAVREYLQTRHGVEADPEEIVWFPGLVPALNIACRAFVRPGEEVLTCTPVYPPFLTAPEFAGVGLRRVELEEKNGQWNIDFAALEKSVTRQTKLFILCNPHNPVGRVFPEATVARVVEFCQRHDLVLISDEIHCDLVLDDLAHTSGLKFSGEGAGPIISMFAPSKTFNLAGLACAFLVIPDPATRRTFQRAARGIVTEVNTFGYAGCQAALLHGWAWQAELLQVLRRNRDRLQEFAASSLPRIEIWQPEATYLAWLDTRALQLTSPTQYFEEHGVGLSDGVPFGATSGFLRLNFGCPTTQLDQALERLAQGVAAL